MKKLLAGMIVLAGTVFGLTACGTPTPAPTVTVTVTPPAPAPLARLQYKPGGTDTSISFVVPAQGYVIVTDCVGTEDGISYTERGGNGFGGTDSVNCGTSEVKDESVVGPSEVKTFSLVNAKLTLTFDAAALKKVSKLDITVKKLDLD